MQNISGMLQTHAIDVKLYILYVHASKLLMC